jgi:hypothetical protein
MRGADSGNPQPLYYGNIAQYQPHLQALSRQLKDHEAGRRLPRSQSRFALT